MRATPNLEWTDLGGKTTQTFIFMIAKMWRNLTTKVINGHISFGDGTHTDNIDGVWSPVTAPVAPNTDFTVTHNLGRVPVGYLVMQKDRAVDIYTGSVAATKTQITLRATVASAVINLFIFLFLFTTATFGQNARKDDIATFNANGFVKVLPGALITVCTSLGAGTPCTPLASICANQVDVVCGATNPFQADVNGNYGFWAPPGTYIVTITSTVAQAKTITYTLATGTGGGGGGGTPGGVATNLQYFLNASTFGGITGSSYNSGTGAVAFPGSLASGGSGAAGSVLLPQGTTPAAVANNWLIGGQGAISGAGVIWLGPNKAGTASGGKLFGTASGATVLLGSSGDSGHSISLSGVTTTQTNVTLCLAANCPAGEYEVELRLNSTVACGTPGPASLTPTITYTDDGGTRTNQGIPMTVNAGVTRLLAMNLGTTTDQAHGSLRIKSTGVNPITVTLTVVNCTAGTQTFSAGIEATQIQ